MEKMCPSPFQKKSRVFFGEEERGGPLVTFRARWQLSNSSFCYIASYVRGQEEAILLCDWLPERARWRYFARCVPQENISPDAINSFIYETCSVKMAGFWRGLFLFVLMELDSVSVHKRAKKDLANIQLCWPHGWSITQISYWISMPFFQGL